MEENEICRAIGRLEGKMDGVDEQLQTISKQLEMLKIFRWKVYGTMVTLTALTGLAIRLIQ